MNESKKVMTLEELEKEFNSDLTVGLNDEQIEVNRAKYGKNALEEKKKTPLILKFLAQFKDPLIIILIVAAIISVIVDPHEWIESVIIAVVVLLNAILDLAKNQTKLNNIRTNCSKFAHFDAVDDIKKIILDSAK